MKYSATEVNSNDEEGVINPCENAVITINADATSDNNEKTVEVPEREQNSRQDKSDLILNSKYLDSDNSAFFVHLSEKMISDKTISQ